MFKHVIATTALLVAPSVHAQLSWTAEQWPLAGDPKIVFDGTTRRLMAYDGGTSLFHFNGVSWQRTRLTGPVPSERRGHVLTYDSTRNRVILFGGGSGGSTLNDTWEWDGTSWTERFPITTPLPRLWAAAAHDPMRGRTVVYGGSTGLGPGPFADTWEWDGNDWLQVANTRPFGRSNAAMAFDPTLGRILLFGGRGLRIIYDDTWTFDGTSWTQLAPATSPRASDGSGFAATASGRLVLFGGSLSYYNAGEDSRTFEWDGANWTETFPALTPGARARCSMAFDPIAGVTLLTGGSNGTTFTTFLDTWEYRGTTFSLIAESSVPSVPFATGAYSEALGLFVVFGETAQGTAETWTYDGGTWTNAAPQTSPPPLRSHAMAEGPSGNVILFGGQDAGATSGDTWSFDGNDWTQLSPSTAPTARVRHTMTYDSGRGRILLFGGESAGLTLPAETWTFDGANWNQLLIANPPERVDHMMTYDSRSDRVLIFSGSADPLGRFPLQDTWAFDGSSWSDVSVPGSPIDRALGRMTYDRARDRVVLYGGARPSTALDDHWEFDGVNWILRGVGQGPGRQAGHLQYYDPNRRETILVTLRSPFEQWHLAPRNPANFEIFAPGCPGSAGTATQAARTLPWLSSTVEGDLSPLPAAGPVVLFLGVSSTTVFGLPLPLDLSPLGLTNCNLAVSIEANVTFASPGGSLAFALPLPMNNALLGRTAYLQWWIADAAAANPARSVVSDAAALTIGAR